MFNYLIKWLAPPVFPGDKEKTWRAALLNSAHLLVLFMLSMVIVGHFVGGSAYTTLIMFDALTIGIILLLRFLLFRGKVNLIGIITIIVGIALVALGQAILGTIRTPTTAMLMLVIIIAGQLFGRKGFILSTVISSITVLCLILAENASLLPKPDYVVNVAQWISYTFMFGLTALLTDYSFHKTANTLKTTIQQSEELEKAHMHLKESHALLTSFAGIAIHDKGQILECNQGLAEFSGFTYEELIGMDSLLLISAESREMVMSNIVAGYEKPYEAIGVRKNGQEFPLRLEARGIPYRGKQVFIVEFRDITKTRDVELKLKAQALQHERLLLMGRHLASSLDIETVFKHVSQEVRTLLGCHGVTIYMLDEQGKMLTPVLSYDPPYEQDVLSTKIDVNSCLTGKAIKAKRGMIFNFADQQPDGFHIEGTPVNDDHLVVAPFIIEGQAIGSLNVYRKNEIFTDDDLALVETFTLYASTAINNAQVHRELLDQINERKQAEADRLIIEKQLHQSQKLEAVGTMVGGISHELNNVLQSMFLYGGLIQHDLPDDEELQSNMHQLLKEGDRARNIVKQILTFSRKTTTDMKPQFIHDQVLEYLSLERASFSANIRIKHDIDMDCGMVLCDKTQIHQIIINLCNNAQHAMEEEGGTLSVGLHQIKAAIENGDVETDFLELTISDTGHGIGSSDLERIFDPFFTTKQLGQGTGLGLSVIHGIVEMIGGQIFVTSAVDEGTKFRILLPVVETEEELQPIQKSEAKAVGFNKSILLVDDEDSIRIATEVALSRKGFIVNSAEDGKQAAELMKEHPSRFDLVITDLTMPNLSGADLTREIRKLNLDIPVILSTGKLGIEDEKDFKDIGITAFIQKPWTANELIAKIQEIDL